MAELQFVFANPVRKGTKKVASQRKLAKISRKGIAVPKLKRKRRKNPYYQKLAKKGKKTVSRGRTVAYPTTKEFKGLQKRIKKAESKVGQAQRDVERAITTSSMAKARADNDPAYKRKKGYRAAMKKLKTATNKRRSAQSRLTSAKKKLSDEKRSRRLAPSQANAWRRSGSGRSVKFVNEPKFGAKKGKKKVAKKKRKATKKRGRKKTVRRKVGRKKKVVKRKARKKASSKRKSVKRRRYTGKRKAARSKTSSKRRKSVAKRRRKKVGRRKARKSKAKYKIAKSRKKGGAKRLYKLNRKTRTFRRANPAIGSVIRNWTGLTMQDAGVLAVGGALYGAVDGAMARYAAPVYNQLVKVPVVGRSMPVLVAGIAALWAAKQFRINALRMLGDGIISASVVSMGVDAAQLIPGLGMSGLGYATPQLGNTVSNYTSGNQTMGRHMPYGKPDFGGVDYTPGMSGVDFTMGGDAQSGLGYATPQLGVVPEGLGMQSPDFGLIPEGMA
jgi:hypothetical protein